jgi:hypothetical protein
MTEPQYQVAAHGTFKEICEYLHCSRATLWRRMKDTPDLFVRLSRSHIILVLPPNPTTSSN